MSASPPLKREQQQAEVIVQRACAEGMLGIVCAGTFTFCVAQGVSHADELQVWEAGGTASH